MHMMLSKWPRGWIAYGFNLCYPGLPGAPTRLPASVHAVAIVLSNKNA
jgi:hypothetical protein